MIRLGTMAIGREPAASRRELAELARRVDDMDNHGTRASSATDAQITQLVSGQGELKAQFAEHQHQHDREAAQRVNGRRWLIGTGLATIVAMTTMITLLLQVLHKLP